MKLGILGLLFSFLGLSHLCFAEHPALEESANQDIAKMELSSQDSSAFLREHLQKIIYSIGCSEQESISVKHLAGIERLKEEKRIDAKQIKNLMEIYLDDFCYHQHGGTRNEAEYRNLQGDTKLCYFSIYRNLDKFLNSNEPFSLLTKEGIKADRENIQIKKRAAVIEKLKCHPKPKFEDQKELASFSSKMKSYYDSKQSSPAAPKIKVQKAISVSKPFEKQAPPLQTAAQTKSPPIPSPSPVPTPAPIHSTQSLQIPEPAAAPIQTEADNLLKKYIQSPEYLFNSPEKILSSEDTQGEHVRIIEEALQNSVYNLACENTPQVLAHQFLKAASLLGRHIDESPKNEFGIALGDSPYSGIRGQIKRTLDSWCLDEQNEKKVERRKKCVEAFEGHLNAFYQYALIDFIKEKQIKTKEQLKAAFELEASNTQSKLNDLIHKLSLGQETLAKGDPKINVHCDSKKASQPFVEAEKKKSEPSSKFSNSDQSLLGPRPDPAPTITTPLPIIEDDEEMRRRGYYSFNFKDNYIYGRPHIIWNIQKAALTAKKEGIIYGVNDINDKDTNGDNFSDTPGHETHQYGLAADFRYHNETGVAAQMNVGQKKKGYSSDRTARAIEILIDTDPKNFSHVYVNDPVVIERINKYMETKYGIKDAAVADSCGGHDNHYHFHWKE